MVLLRERVFVVEFKAGEEEFKHQDVDQVLDYALDLKNFHQGSADRWIIPILVATEETAFSTLELQAAQLIPVTLYCSIKLLSYKAIIS